MALHPGGTRAVSFHRGRTPEMWKIGVFYVALGIRYVWSVGEARDNLERKGIFLFPKEWNAPEKNSVFIAVAVVFLVVKPVHWLSELVPRCRTGRRRLSADAG